MKIEVGSRVVCVDGFCYEEYRGAVVKMVQRSGCWCAVVLVDDSDRQITERIGNLVAESEFESGDF